VDAVTKRQLDGALGRRHGHLYITGEALAEFNRYNRRQLRIANRKIATLRVGGGFEVPETDAFLTTLNRLFDVRAKRVADSAGIIELARIPAGSRSPAPVRCNSGIVLALPIGVEDELDVPVSEYKRPRAHEHIVGTIRDST